MNDFYCVYCQHSIVQNFTNQGDFDLQCIRLKDFVDPYGNCDEFESIFKNEEE